MADPTSNKPNAALLDAMEKARKAHAGGLPWARRPFPATWDEYEQGVRDWVDNHWEGGADRRCAHCQNSMWLVGEVVSLETTPGYPLGPDSFPGVYPTAQIVCQPCGNIVLINALFIFDPTARPDDPA